jgi:O-methyltransferase
MPQSAESEEAEVQAERLFQRVKANLHRGRSKVLIWGANMVCSRLLLKLETERLEGHIVAIVDDRLFGRTLGRHVISDPRKIGALQFDLLVITDDSSKESILLKYSQLDSRMPKVVLAGTGHLDFENRVFSEILAQCTVKSRAGGYPEMLIHIFQSLCYLVERGTQGSVVEFGVFEGGTTAFIAQTLRRLGASAKIYGFDTFEGFPPRRTVLDQFDEDEYRSVDYESVRRYLEPLGVTLVKGDVSETYREIEGIPLMFSFFDTDNYSPTRSSLELCFEQTEPGGILAFDHYYCDERWVETVGERIAIKEVLSRKRAFNLHGTGIFIKF